MTAPPNEGPVFADERQARIAELVMTRGRARIGELASQFGVTEPTIRKDLSALQQRGMLKRTYGGALALHPIVDREFAGREGTNRSGKEAIAAACLEPIPLKLENVAGKFVFTQDGVNIDGLSGRVDNNGLKINGRIEGYTPEAPVARVTLTRSAILSARTLLITITGQQKRELLEGAIADGHSAKLPIGALLRLSIRTSTRPLTPDPAPDGEGQARPDVEGPA